MSLKLDGKKLSLEIEERLNDYISINKRKTIKKICLELIFGLSFLETSIKRPQLIRTSVKVKSHEKISSIPKYGERSCL